VPGAFGTMFEDPLCPPQAETANDTASSDATARMVVRMELPMRRNATIRPIVKQLKSTHKAANHMRAFRP